MAAEGDLSEGGKGLNVEQILATKLCAQDGVTLGLVCGFGMAAGGGIDVIWVYVCHNHLESVARWSRNGTRVVFWPKCAACVRPQRSLLFARYSSRVGSPPCLPLRSRHR